MLVLRDEKDKKFRQAKFDHEAEHKKLQRSFKEKEMIMKSLANEGKKLRGEIAERNDQVERQGTKIAELTAKVADLEADLDLIGENHNASDGVKK